MGNSLAFPLKSGLGVIGSQKEAISEVAGAAASDGGPHTVCEKKR